MNVFVDVSDDALLCCVEEYCESWDMDLSASFHATPCMRMLKNFNWLLGKFRLADMKVLDVAGIGDGVLKITFGTEWILKNMSLGTCKGSGTKGSVEASGSLGCQWELCK
ncbi:hypothetical protein Tco_0167015 [Tanacetum coccineum]